MSAISNVWALTKDRTLMLVTKVAAELGVLRSRAEDFSDNSSNNFQFSLNAVFS